MPFKTAVFRISLTVILFSHRSKQIESACFSGTAAFMEVRIQSVVVEFILNHVDVLFSGKISAVIQEGAGRTQMDFVYYSESVSKLLQEWETALIISV